MPGWTLKRLFFISFFYSCRGIFQATVYDVPASQKESVLFTLVSKFYYSVSLKRISQLMEYCNSSNSISGRAITICNELTSEAEFTLNLYVFCTSCVQPAVTEYEVNNTNFSDREKTDTHKQHTTFPKTGAQHRQNSLV